MTSIRFECEATIALAPEAIAANILDLARWPEFPGYGPVPGIRAAEFQVRTPEVVGTRVLVTDSNGARHVEEIVEWRPTERVKVRMCELPVPLMWLTMGIDETWLFERDGAATRVVRMFELWPRSAITRPALWLISRWLRKAIERHLAQMRDEANP